MDILQDQAFVADLQFLSTVHEDVAAEFAYTAANTILRRDLKPPNFARAAKELQVSVQTVEASVRALSHLYLHAASKLIPADKLTAVLGQLGWSPTLKDCVTSSYAEHIEQIQATISDSTFTVPSFYKLEWRLDVQVASRSLRRQATPSFLLKLIRKSMHVDQNAGLLNQQCHEGGHGFTGMDVEYMEADYATLKSICGQLEDALANLKLVQARRKARPLK